jgi:hypothetical protein
VNTVHQNTSQTTGEAITLPVVPHVRTLSTMTVAHGMVKRSTVRVVMKTMSGTVITAEKTNGMAMVTTVMRMRRRVVTLSTVTRTDLAHTSSARVNTISALS